MGSTEDSERRIDADLRARFDEIESGYLARADRNEKRIAFLTKWTFIILAVVAAAQLALGSLSVYLVVQNGFRQGDIKHTVAAIQQQRLEATWGMCRSQNARHAETVRRLQWLIRGIKDPAQRVRARADMAGTLSLIDALAPYQSCAGVIHDRFGYSGARLRSVVRRLERLNP